MDVINPMTFLLKICSTIARLQGGIGIVKHPIVRTMHWNHLNNLGETLT